MTLRPRPRRLVSREKRPAPYDVTVNQPPTIEHPTTRQIAARRRVSELWDEHAEVFFAVVRDADRRQREDGEDQLTALEQALDHAEAALAADRQAVDEPALPPAVTPKPAGRSRRRAARD